MTFNDGDAHKDFWIDNRTFSGKVDKTVEIAQLVAQVHYVISNGGTGVENKGQLHYFPAGKRESAITWANSGGTVRLPQGNYDVRVPFSDGLARKELWLTDQNFAGTADKTVELGITLAKPTVAVTQNGADVGNKAHVTFFPPGSDKDIGTVASSEQTVVIAGSYDIRASLPAATGWLRAATINGSPTLTIEVQQPKTQLKVTALRNSNPLPGA